MYFYVCIFFEPKYEFFFFWMKGIKEKKMIIWYFTRDTLDYFWESCSFGFSSFYTPPWEYEKSFERKETRSGKIVPYFKIAIFFIESDGIYVFVSIFLSKNSLPTRNFFFYGVCIISGNVDNIFIHSFSLKGHEFQREVRHQLDQLLLLVLVFFEKLCWEFW